MFIEQLNWVSITEKFIIGLGGALGTGLIWLVRTVMKNRRDTNQAFHKIREINIYLGRENGNGKRGKGCTQQETVDE